MPKHEEKIGGKTSGSIAENDPKIKLWDYNYVLYSPILASDLTFHNSYRIILISSVADLRKYICLIFNYLERSLR